MKKYIVVLFLCFTTALMGCSVTDEGKSTNQETNNGKETNIEKPKAIEWIKQPFADYPEDPIALYDKGFLVKDGNKEGFMGPDGNLILEMKYKFQPCFMNDAYGVMEGADGLVYLSQLLDVEGYAEGCWTGIVGPSVHYYYDNETKEISVIQNEMEDPTYKISTVDEATASKQIQADTYFLPVNLKIETKENGEEISSNEGYVLVLKGKLQSDTVYEDLHMKKVMFRKHDVSEALNAVKKDGKWAIMDQEGTLLSDFAYEEADVLNDRYVKVKKADTVGLFTKDKEEYLYSDITSITAPVKDVVFAQADGKWGLMKLAS